MLFAFNMTNWRLFCKEPSIIKNTFKKAFYVDEEYIEVPNEIITKIEDKKFTTTSIYELKDSTRDLGVDLRKFFTQDPEGYSPECHVSFSTKLNDKETKLDYTTRMTLGSTGPVSFK